jgi:hypothetical protein
MEEVAVTVTYLPTISHCLSLAVLDKLSAAVIVALSAVLLYLILLRLTTRVVALALVAVCVLGKATSALVRSAAPGRHEDGCRPSRPAAQGGLTRVLTLAPRRQRAGGC